MTTELSIIEILPQSEHLYSVIWLHGLGADGHDFEGIASELHLNAKVNIHFIFPNAPIQPVTINGGAKMRSWYDILDISLDHKVAMDDIYSSASLIEQLIEQEKAKGIPAERILLAGFSQGGVIALHVGLTAIHKLAGIVALSTYFPTLEPLKRDGLLTNNGTAIFIGHGILDAVIAIETGKATFDSLKVLDYDVVWHDYLMEHSVCIEEIDHLSTFINKLFKAP